MQKTLTVYAEKVYVDIEDSQVTLTGVDLGNIVAEFSAKDILDHIDPSTIHDYLKEYLKED